MTISALANQESSPLRPCVEHWEGLGGERFRETLDEFYALVFADPVLHPFFVHSSPEHVAGKVYSFYRQTITGEDVYFGYRPRNAHHWMVISDDAFDRREAILEATLRRRGVAEPWIGRLLAIDEVFRKQIVKDKPFPRKVSGSPLPLEGYETIPLSVGSLCDECGAEIAEGELATYHVRTGKTYCAACAPDAAAM